MFFYYPKSTNIQTVYHVKITIKIISKLFTIFHDFIIILSIYKLNVRWDERNRIRKIFPRKSRNLSFLFFQAIRTHRATFLPVLPIACSPEINTRTKGCYIPGVVRHAMHRLAIPIEPNVSREI